MSETTYPPAGRERDRLIAEKLGWRVIDANDNPHGLRIRGPNWQLTTPDGIGLGYAWNAAEAWNHPDLPQWSTDLNALWQLYAALPGNWSGEITNLSGGGVMPRINAASIVRYLPEAQARTIHGKEGEDAASVGSEAWLEWFDAFGQDAKGQGG